MARIWDSLTTAQVEDLKRDRAVLILPFGAIEQHGPHLPLDTDWHIANSFAMAVADELPDAVVLPGIPWGFSNYHTGFAGTISIGHEVLHKLLMEIFTGLRGQGFSKFVMVVGHAGNSPVASLVVRSLASEHDCYVLHLDCLTYCLDTFNTCRQGVMGSEFHAGELETSLELFLRPGLVNLSQSAPSHPIDPRTDFGISDGTADIAKLGRASVGYDFVRAFPDGVMGDPNAASVATGEQCFTAAVRQMIRVIDEYSQA